MVAPLVVTAVRMCATMAACYLFASLLPTLRQVQRDKSVAQVPALPILSMFANCIGWALYGFLARDFFPLVATNLIGLAFSIYYLVIYYQNSGIRRKLVQQQLLATIAAMALLALYPLVSTAPPEQVQAHMGYAAIAMCAIMFGSPLAVVKEVVRTKNTDLLPFTMIIAGVVNCSLWLTYGFILMDAIVIVPNAINIVLGLIQVSLFLIFPKGKGYDQVEKRKHADSKETEDDSEASTITIKSDDDAADAL